jgi:Tfp pilus assembly protein PilX
MKLQRQKGMTLIMGLIMLIVLTLLALTSFSLGKSNLIIVSNMQQRDQNIAAAHELLEELISNDKFHDTPDFAVINPCKGDNTRCVDINGDGVNDITVRLARPICVKSQIIKVTDLDPANSQDVPCLVSPDSQSGGIEGKPAGNSSCANSTWELNVTSTDDATEAAVTVTQGVAARVPMNDVVTNCP